jgi:hypothetical protein
MLVIFPRGLAAENSTDAWIVSPSMPPMQQLPFPITTEPVNKWVVVNVAGVDMEVGETEMAVGSIAGVVES